MGKIAFIVLISFEKRDIKRVNPILRLLVWRAHDVFSSHSSHVITYLPCFSRSWRDDPNRFVHQYGHCSEKSRFQTLRWIQTHSAPFDLVGQDLNTTLDNFKVVEFAAKFKHYLATAFVFFNTTRVKDEQMLCSKSRDTINFDRGEV